MGGLPIALERCPPECPPYPEKPQNPQQAGVDPHIEQIIVRVADGIIMPGDLVLVKEPLEVTSPTSNRGRSLIIRQEVCQSLSLVPLLGLLRSVASVILSLLVPDG